MVAMISSFMLHTPITKVSCGHSTLYCSRRLCVISITVIMVWDSAIHAAWPLVLAAWIWPARILPMLHSGFRMLTSSPTQFCIAHCEAA